MKIAVVTDSNSGITQKEADNYENLRVIPMPFTINEEEYFEGNFGCCVCFDSRNECV